MSDRIDIVCDDASHARGKEAKIATFAHLDGVGWVSQFQFGAATLADYQRPDGSTRHTYACRLCEGRRPRGQAPLACTEETLQWLLDIVAGHGMSQINLQLANLIAAKRLGR